MYFCLQLKEKNVLEPKFMLARRSWFLKLLPNAVTWWLQWVAWTFMMGVFMKTNRRHAKEFLSLLPTSFPPIGCEKSLAQQYNPVNCREHYYFLFLKNSNWKLVVLAADREPMWDAHRLGLEMSSQDPPTLVLLLTLYSQIQNTVQTLFVSLHQN